MSIFCTGVEDLQGEAVEFLLNVTGFSGSQAIYVSGDRDSTVVTDLQPNTQYGVLLTTETWGGNTITSDVVYATTSDGGENKVINHIMLSVNCNQ